MCGSRARRSQRGGPAPSRAAAQDDARTLVREVREQYCRRRDRLRERRSRPCASGAQEAFGAPAPSGPSLLWRPALSRQRPGARLQHGPPPTGIAPPPAPVPHAMPHDICDRQNAQHAAGPDARAWPQARARRARCAARPRRAASAARRPTLRPRAWTGCCAASSRFGPYPALPYPLQERRTVPEP